MSRREWRGGEVQREGKEQADGQKKGKGVGKKKERLVGRASEGGEEREHEHFISQGL